ncbi:MAG: M48 family metallopeptidase [Alphaproteobacteria bacterium]|nr:M48 family metallopeptidase [Alphaproteobacteria bacterium]
MSLFRNKPKAKPHEKRDGGKQRAAPAGEVLHLAIDGAPVEVKLRLNPRARRIIVKVHPATGEVTVVAPSRRGLKHALDFARGEQDWIARQRARVPGPVTLAAGVKLPFRGISHEVRHSSSKGPAPVWRDANTQVIWVTGRAEHASRRILDFLKREARGLCEAKALAHGALIGVTPSRITMRDTASRWGSCSTSRALSFSWRLIFAPDAVRDYVVAHEVAHLREMNHGPRFWKLVEKLHPEFKAAQAWLRTHGKNLQRYKA